MRGLRRVTGQFPGAIDAAVAAIVAAVCGVALASRSGVTGVVAGPADWAAIGLLIVPLLWRRRAPVVVFYLTVGLSWLSDVALARSPAGLLVPLVAIYAVARHRSRRHVWPAVAGVALSLVVNGFLGNLDWPAVVAGTALLAATILLGVNLQTRQAYLAALEERADRLERERDQQAQLAAAAERARIAREMHDIVAHNLVVMVALADGAAFTADAAPDRAADVMRQVSATGRQALGEMRRLVGLLRRGAPAAEAGARVPQPGFDDIDVLVEQVRAAGLHVAVTTDGAPGPWAPGAGLAVYRVVQEALTNTLKHAGPRATAQVRLRYTVDTADVEVLDDGAGRPARTVAAADRHGLAGMLERAAAYDGRLDAGPRAGAGWQVRAHLEFHDQSGAS